MFVGRDVRARITGKLASEVTPRPDIHIGVAAVSGANLADWLPFEGFARRILPPPADSFRITAHTEVIRIQSSDAPAMFQKRSFVQRPPKPVERCQDGIEREL